jgi:hypothetical protein
MTFGRNRTTQPIEVGTVDWMRELDEALELSKQTSKPIFALFQEVPGCAGCQQFGADVLSDPLLVEAIENEFVPMLIHNNTGGRDAEVLATYGEPAWNYQVVRFLHPDGSDVIERRDRVWETGPLAARMIEALQRSDRPVPEYLRLHEQAHSDRLSSVYLAQPCFWVGEMEIGRIDGVVTTEAGFINDVEVTKARFDPRVVSPIDLVGDAKQRGVASAVFVDSEIAGVVASVIGSGDYRAAPKSDQKRQVRGRLRIDDLPDAQMTKLNSFLPMSLRDAAAFVSPRQLRALGWAGRLGEATTDEH